MADKILQHNPFSCQERTILPLCVMYSKQEPWCSSCTLPLLPLLVSISQLMCAIAGRLCCVCKFPFSFLFEKKKILVAFAVIG